MTSLSLATKRLSLFVPPDGWIRVHVPQFAGQVVIVAPKPKKRSLDQNAYWWAEPVARLAEELGYTASQMHYTLLGECFGYQTGPTGKVVPIKPSSSDLTTTEFTQMIEWVQVFAVTELHCAVMPPQMWFERDGVDV